MSEQTGAITFKGNPLTLVGDPVKVGQSAPAATLTAQDLSPVSLDSFKGKVVILSTVPSLDTPVCQVQTQKFNEEVAKLGDGVKLVTVSMDLPMAQKRWCGAANATHGVTLSDYKDHSFGKAYGLRIKELGLIARAVLVIDKTGKVQYTEVVSEVTQEPNYDAALAAVNKLV